MQTKFPKKFSKKYRLVTLLFASTIPGMHRIYVGKIKSGLCMLLAQVFLLFVSKIQIPKNSILISLLVLTLFIFFVIFIIIDLSAISLGIFKDAHELPLLRKANCEISNKNNMTAILLCTFLGFLGIHRFYLGKKITGSIILCSFLIMLTLFFFNIKIMGIMFVIFCLIWAIYCIDLLALSAGVLTDAQGKLPKDFSS